MNKSKCNLYWKPASLWSSTRTSPVAKFSRGVFQHDPRVPYCLHTTGLLTTIKYQYTTAWSCLPANYRFLLCAELSCKLVFSSFLFISFFFFFFLNRRPVYTRINNWWINLSVSSVINHAQCFQMLSGYRVTALRDVETGKQSRW